MLHCGHVASSAQLIDLLLVRFRLGLRGRRLGRGRAPGWLMNVAREDRLQRAARWERRQRRMDDRLVATDDEYDIADALEKWSEQERSLRAHGDDYKLSPVDTSPSHPRASMKMELMGRYR